MSNIGSMESTLDNVKNLQEKESRLYSSLGVSVDGKPVNSDEQQKILDEINSLTDLRINLIKELERQYSLLNLNIEESNNDIADELASIELMEKQLDEKKKQISKLKNIEANKLRMADINNYYANRSQFVSSIYYAIVLTMVGVCVVLIMRKLVFFIPSVFYNLLLLLVIIGGFGRVMYKVMDLYSRDKMNFDKYDYSNVDPKITRPSVYEYDMNQLGKIRDVLVGQEQQLQNKTMSYFGNDSDYLIHQCNNDDEKVYITSDGKQYSQSNKTMEECQNDCSADDQCDLYLMSDDNTCHLYKDVNNASTYCSAGSGHTHWGKIKKKHKTNTTHMDDQETFMNISSAFVPHDPLNNYDLNLLH